MNREQRRAAGRRAKRQGGQQLAHAYADDYACPDCLSEASLVEHAPGVMLLEVRHDDTCPTYRAMG